MGIRIDALDPVVAAVGRAVIPAMQSEKTVKLTVEQINNLVIGGAAAGRDTLKKLSDALDAGLLSKLDTLQPFIDVASASTVNLGSQASQNIRITGTTTISSFGTAPAGTVRNLRFSGALTLTHNGTSLILPNGGANIVTASGDALTAVSLGSGNWFVAYYQRSLSSSKMAVIQDQKPAGTTGGNAVVGWQTRTLNTEVSDPDNIVTLSSNTIVTTVDCWVDAECEAFLTNYNMLRLWNVTDNFEVARGANQYSGSSAPGWSSQPRVQGRITAGKTYRLEMYAATAAASTGLGTSANAGGPEIYCNLVLRGLN